MISAGKPIERDTVQVCNFDEVGYARFSGPILPVAIRSLGYTKVFSDLFLGRPKGLPGCLKPLVKWHGSPLDRNILFLYGKAQLVPFCSCLTDTLPAGYIGSYCTTRGVTMKVFAIEESEQVCANCKHYIQHYMRVERGDSGEFVELRPVNYGHCIYPRVKDRKPGNSCGLFVQGNREVF